MHKRFFSCGVDHQRITFRLTGFSRAEGDTVIIRSHYHNSGEPTKDSIIYYSEAELAYNPNFFFDTLRPPYGVVADTLDISVSIPGAGKTVTITEITCEPPCTESRKAFILAVCTGKTDACYNRLLSYKVNSVKTENLSYDRDVAIDIRR
jgi:hypothetical protein